MLKRKRLCFLLRELANCLWVTVSSKKCKHLVTLYALVVVIRPWIAKSYYSKRGFPSATSCHCQLLQVVEQQVHYRHYQISIFILLSSCSFTRSEEENNCDSQHLGHGFLHCSFSVSWNILHLCIREDSRRRMRLNFMFCMSVVLQLTFILHARHQSFSII